jgi:UDP-N-acetylmuramoyl-L-alanyl-D-glutamate--2,6-diaminopimelate ligase
MGAAVERYADVPVVTSDNPRTEVPEAIIDEILDGMSNTGDRLVDPDRRCAIEEAIALAGPEDLVLIAGKGHETYQVIGTTRHDFDDRLVAQSALRAAGAGSLATAGGEA